MSNESWNKKEVCYSKSPLGISFLSESVRSNSQQNSPFLSGRITVFYFMVELKKSQNPLGKICQQVAIKARRKILLSALQHGMMNSRQMVTDVEQISDSFKRLLYCCQSSSLRLNKLELQKKNLMCVIYLGDTFVSNKYTMSGLIMIFFFCSRSRLVGVMTSKERGAMEEMDALRIRQKYPSRTRWHKNKIVRVDFSEPQYHQKDLVATSVDKDIFALDRNPLVGSLRVRRC